MGRSLSGGFKNLSFDSEVTVILGAVFVLDDFSVNFVDKQINRGIEVFLDGFAVDIFAGNMKRDVCSVPVRLYGQNNLCVDDVVEVAQYARHFRVNVFPDGGSNVEMVTSDA